MEPREYATLESLEDRFWWYRALHRLVLERISAYAPAPPLRILDAGCGTGGMMRRLRARYPDAALTGIDWSPHAVARAARIQPSAAEGGCLHDPDRTRPAVALPTQPRPGAGSATDQLVPGRVRPSGPRVARASVEALPFATGSFDLVVSLDVLYHAGVRDDVGALREFARVLRPGGCLVLNLPAFESLRSSHDRAIHTARRYRRKMLVGRLTSAGLAPLRLHYWNGFLFPALAVVRWIRRGDARADRPIAPSDVRPLPPLVNRTLQSALALERIWLRRAPLPFGLSLLAVAIVPDRAGGPRP